MTGWPADEKLGWIAAPDFDLAVTLGCGQVFHWRQAGEGWAGAIGDRAVYLAQEGESLTATAGCEGVVRRYLALDHPLAEIRASFPDDAAMRAAAPACRGLRIIRQPRWECLATFITSALKQVAHIAQISHTVRERFGEQVGEAGGRGIFAYPTAARVARLEEADLRACGLGFRARSLLEAARTIGRLGQETGSDPLEGWGKLTRAEALERLTSLRGVGTKVANCVLLFAYEHLDAFPVDVWIERVLREGYFAGKPEVPAGELQAFADGHFGRYGGYAQQYLFHYARTVGKRQPREVVAAATAEGTAPTRRVRKGGGTRGGLVKKAFPAGRATG